MPVKFQPSPKREIVYVTKIIDTTEPNDGVIARDLDISFEESSPPTVMNNPTASTAARWTDRSQEEIPASIEARTERKRLEPPLPADFPQLPSDPTPDAILEWLGSTREGSDSAKPRPQLPVSQEMHCLFRSDSEITVEHVEEISETGWVTVPVSRIKLLEARLERSEIAIQLSRLEKEITEISSKEDDFLTEEQKMLQDGTDLAKIKKATEAGIELLNTIQYQNSLCKDDPSVFQEAYDHWFALRKSVATYLFNRSEVQHVNQVKCQKFIELKQKKDSLLAKFEEAELAILKLGSGNTESAQSSQEEISNKGTERKDSAIDLGTNSEVPYFPPTPCERAPSVKNGCSPIED